MPLTYDTAHASMKLIFEYAVQAASPPGDPDPEFDLQGHAEAHWGQHSWRRMGEKTARDATPQWTLLRPDGRRRRSIQRLGRAKTQREYADTLRGTGSRSPGEALRDHDGRPEEVGGAPWARVALGVGAPHRAARRSSSTQPHCDYFYFICLDQPV